MSQEYQVEDNPQLLEKMMDDLTRADKLYKPGIYWFNFQKTFQQELSKIGLKDFRRRKGSVLASFASTEHLDLRFRFRPKIKVRGINKLIHYSFQASRNLGLQISFNFDAENITKYFYRHVQAKFQGRSMDLGRCPTNRYGNPEHLCRINDGYWSFAHLQYCSMFIDAYPDMAFGPDMVFCELGPGLGRNIEVLAALYPKATFILFDIPPQLYVAHQYLRSIFKERVVGYDEAVALKPARSDAFAQSIKGKIFMLPTWKMPKWKAAKIDIFWNSASLQEMEPEIVGNYLDIVKAMDPGYVYINAVPKGLPGFTANLILEEEYLRPFQEGYTLVREYPTDYFLMDQTYKSFIFKNHSQGK